MAHHLHAIILRGPFDSARAREFDLRSVELPFELTLFLLVDRYVDAWAKRLAIPGAFPKPMYNFHVLHHMMAEISREPLFAIIETEYFGGVGEQCAAVYRGSSLLLDPEEPGATINAALRVLGVFCKDGLDEFDTVGLREFRSSANLFGAGYED